MATTPKLMTAEELLALPAGGQRYELIAGELREMPPTGGEHGGIESRFNVALAVYVYEHQLGEVLVGEAGFLLARNPDTVQAADIAFISRERLAGTGLVPGYQPGAPDLAAEIVSPNDRPAEVAAKVARWLEHGTRMVVVLYPNRRTVAVHRPGQAVRTLQADDFLDGGDVVPGWRVAVRDLFTPRW